MLNIDIKPLLWRRGLYFGMIGSAYSVAAFLLPQVELFPCLVFIVSTATMLVHLLVSYYQIPIPESFTDLQREERIEVKHTVVRQLGIGLIFTIGLAGVGGYMQSQTTDNRIQQGFAGVVYKLSEEVKSLHSAVTNLTKDVKQLQQQANESAISDSIARKRNFHNQEQILKKVKR